MVKVLFVCLGNICRSPMAEFVFKDMLQKQNLSDVCLVASAGTSSEEAGNPVHRGTAAQLSMRNISCAGKRARKIVRSDYSEYDYLIGMERRNLADMLSFFGGDPAHKLFRLLDFSESPRDISAPWYTGDFERTYRDVSEGCKCFLEFLRREKKI